MGLRASTDEWLRTMKNQQCRIRLLTHWTYNPEASGVTAECSAIELLRNNRSRQRRISPLKRTIFIANGLASPFCFYFAIMFWVYVIVIQLFVGLTLRQKPHLFRVGSILVRVGSCDFVDRASLFWPSGPIHEVTQTKHETLNRLLRHALGATPHKHLTPPATWLIFTALASSPAYRPLGQLGD